MFRLVVIGPFAGLAMMLVTAGAVQATEREPHRPMPTPPLPTTSPPPSSGAASSQVAPQPVSPSPPFPTPQADAGQVPPPVPQAGTEFLVHRPFRMPTQPAPLPAPQTGAEPVPAPQVNRP